MVGDLEAAKLEAILAAGATPGQIEQAMTWAAGESAVIGGELTQPLAGPVAASTRSSRASCRRSRIATDLPPYRFYERRQWIAQDPTADPPARAVRSRSIGRTEKGLEPASDSPYIRHPGAIVRAWPEISEPLPEVPRTRF